MPQVGAAAIAIGGAFASGAGAVIGGAGAILGGTALGGGIGGAVLGAFSKIALGAALNVASKALLPKEDPKGPSGTRLQYETGENIPASRILGKYYTAGDLVYHNSWGAPGDTPHEYYVQVIEIADFPANLSRVRVNGEWATLDGTLTSSGWGVEGYQSNEKFRLFIKFYDGSQTVADPYLIDKFGSDPDFPWETDMIGRGLCYAIVTTGFRPEVHRQVPQIGFEVQARHYDRRKDGTAGGTGSHRWNDSATWEPSSNIAVIAENVLRGFRDPVTGEFIWGGQEIGNRELPSSIWFAAMNECEIDIDLDAGGTEPQFRAGLEALFNREPASILEELFAGGQGAVAEVAGEWHIRMGAPGASVYAFTDADIIVTSEDTFSVFPSLNDAFNGISAKYPEPDEGWAAKDAPIRESADYLADDGGRRNVASIDFAAVPYANQVQRLQKAALEDSRRFRRHDLVLPPEARKLAPLDVVSWTSERNGYSNKQFEVDAVEDLKNGCVAVSLREVDPNDYSWSSDLELPTSVTDGVRPGRQTDTVNFSVAATYAKDAAGNQRRPDISLTYGAKSNIERVEYQVRLLADTAHEPVTGIAPANEGGGVIRIGSVLPLTNYEVRARYRPGKNRPWSNWMGVTTLDVGFIEADLAQVIRDKLDQGIADAAAAAAEAQEALAKANEVEDTLEGLNQEVLDQLEAITDELAGIDTGSIQELRGIAIASQRKGWVRNPAFSEWTGSLPDNWSATLGGYGVESADGYLGSAIYIDVPGGGPEVSLRARSNAGTEMPGADYNTEYVVLGIRAVWMSGTFDGAYLRAEWRNSSTGAWTAGTGPSVLANEWNFTFDPNLVQDKAFVYKRPTGSFDAIRINFVPHPAGSTATTVRVDYLDLREATKPEIQAYEANGYADAAVTTLNATITGPGGAIAASMDTVRAEFGAADAIITTNVTAVANNVSSLAGQVTALESATGGNNYVRNPDFVDGARPAGQTPNFWGFWDSNFSVEARGGGSNASSSAPTAYYGVIAAGSSTATTRAHTEIQINENDRIAIGGKFAATGSGVSVEAGLRVRWMDADFTVLSSSTHYLTITATNWQDLAQELTPPAGARYYDLWVRRNSGQSLNNIPFTSVYSRKVDGVAYAKAEQALATATDAESSLASITSTVEAEFDDFAAFVSAGQTAVATADAAQSAYVIRTSAGGGGATFGIYSWDDEDGSGSAIKLEGDQVTVPGSLSAQSFVITDLGYNKVPDDQLQSANVWSGTGFAVNKTTSRPADSIGEIYYTTTPGPDERLVTAQTDFAVRPNMRLSTSFQVAGVGTGNFRAGAEIRFRDRDGGYISDSNIQWITGTNNTIQNGSGVIVVPSGAYKAAWRFKIDGSSTNMDVRFFAPKAIEQSDGNILITPNSITGAQLVKTEVLIAASAQIGELTVGTSNIQDNAITDTYSALTEATFKVENGVIDNWTTIQTLTVTKARDNPTFFRAYLEARREDPGSPRAIAIRIVRMNGAGDSVQSTVTIVAATINDSDYSTIQASGLDLGSWTTRQFRIQAFMDTPEDVLFQNVYLSALQEVVPKK